MNPNMNREVDAKDIKPGTEIVVVPDSMAHDETLCRARVVTLSDDGWVTIDFGGPKPMHLPAYCQLQIRD